MRCLNTLSSSVLRAQIQYRDATCAKVYFAKVKFLYIFGVSLPISVLFHISCLYCGCQYVFGFVYSYCERNCEQASFKFGQRFVFGKQNCFRTSMYLNI